MYVYVCQRCCAVLRVRPRTDSKIASSFAYQFNLEESETVDAEVSVDVVENHGRTGGGA